MRKPNSIHLSYIYFRLHASWKEAKNDADRLKRGKVSKPFRFHHDLLILSIDINFLTFLHQEVEDVWKHLRVEDSKAITEHIELKYFCRESDYESQRFA